MKTIIILLAIQYIIGFIGSYRIIRRVYSKGGSHSRGTPGIAELLVCLLPMVNFLFFFSESNFKFDADLSKLFRIKK